MSRQRAPEYRHPKYTPEGHIDCELYFRDKWMPFTVVRGDKGSLFDTEELFDRIVEHGDVAPYVPPTEEEIREQKAAIVRQTRANILARHVDPIVTNPLRWGELSAEEQAAYVTYRKALLDIPQQDGFPDDVTFPRHPNGTTYDVNHIMGE